MKLQEDKEVVYELDNPSDDDVPEESHKSLLNAISYMYKKQRIELPKRSEAAKDISEFNLSSNNETGGNKVSVNDLLVDLKEKVTHRDINKKVKAAQQKSQPLPKPLEKNKVDEIVRSIGYIEVKEKLNKWNSIVERNKLATQLVFPLKEQTHRKEAPNFLTQYKEQTDLEKAMAAVLNQSEVAQEERKLENELSRLSIEEMIEKRQMMAKMRARESYRIAKAIRQNKIKSKKYRRVLKKERIKQELKNFEELKKTDPEAALAKLQEIERARAEERITLRHRNTGKWAKSRAIRAKYDTEARIQLAEQLAKSRELTRKIQVDKSDHSDSEGEVEEDVEYEGDEGSKQNSESGNPWAKKPTVIDNFLNGYRQFWAEKNQVKDTSNVSSESAEDSTEDSSRSQFKLIIEAPESDKHSSNNIEESITSQLENPENNLNKNNSIASNDTEEHKLSSGESNSENIKVSLDNEGTRVEKDVTYVENISTDIGTNHLNAYNDTEEQDLGSDDEGDSNDENVNESSDDEDPRTGMGETPVENILKDTDKNHLTASNGTDKQESNSDDESDDDNIEESSDNEDKAETSEENISKDIDPDSEDEIIDVCSISVNDYESDIGNISKTPSFTNCESVFNRNRSPEKHLPSEGILKMGANKTLAKRKSCIKAFKLSESPFQTARTRQIMYNQESSSSEISDVCGTLNESDVCETSNEPKTVKTNCGSWEVSKETPITKLPKQKRKRNHVEVNLDDMFDDAEYAVKNCAFGAVKKIKLSKPKKQPKNKTSNSKKPVSPAIKSTGTSVRNTGIDEALLELNEKGISSGVNDLQSIKEKLDSGNIKENKEPEVDPNKYINVKPKRLITEPSQLEQGGDDDEDDDDDRAVKQKMQLMEAFADEDIANEFSKEKEDLNNKNKAKEIDLTMPGWGSWGGTGIEQRPKSQRKRRRFIVKLPKIPRRDENRELVIINEDPIPKLREQLVRELPYPFTSVHDFEASIRAPIGKTWVPERAHRKLIEPPVITKLGTIIEPMSNNVAMPKKNKLLNDDDLLPSGSKANQKNNKRQKFRNQKRKKPYNKS